MKHTPTPWFTNESQKNTIDSESLQGVAGACGANYWRGEEPMNEQDCANAARIVACVNACEGFSNEDLEKFQLELTNKLRTP